MLNRRPQSSDQIKQSNYSAKNNNKRIVESRILSKTTPSFFSHSFTPDKITIDIYQHMAHLKPFSVHNNELDIN